MGLHRISNSVTSPVCGMRAMVTTRSGLNVTSWTHTQITIQGFTGSYGVSGWMLNHGDQAQVQVWNAQTGAGPAMYNLTIQ
jgi:hypothetical protein